MMTFLVWSLLAAVLAVAFWIAHLVRDVNARFDQLEHKLDVIIDQLEGGAFAGTQGVRGITPDQAARLE